MNPHQQNPTVLRRDSRGNTARAVAPYNFVPLPEQVIYLDPAEVADQDQYSGLTGHVECTLKTLTPLYTRTALSPESFEKWGEKIREMLADDAEREKYAQFFHVSDPSQPVIPGSTLRGMVRTLLEIISYSKVQWVTDKQLFFRTMDNSAIGDAYRGRMMHNGQGLPEGGFLSKQGQQYLIQKYLGCTPLDLEAGA